MYDIDDIELYYVQNEKQYRKLLIGLIENYDINGDDFYDTGISGCDLFEDEENECHCCERDECELKIKINDKNIIEKFYLRDDDKLEFPFILAYDFQKMHSYPFFISSLKNNTKKLI